MIFGTDLAIERREITNSGKNDGVTVKKRRIKSASVTEIEITTDAGAEKLGKPVGTYVTVELPPFSSEFDDADSRMFAVRDEIKKLLPKNTSGVLVVGLGNSDITPDALGPKTAKDIFSTRHITKSLAEEIGLPSLRPVSSASPGVLGQTGIESAEMIRGIMNETSPDRYYRHSEGLSAYLGAMIADSRARDYAAVGYLNRAAKPAELACGECVDDYHGAGLYHIHGAQEKLARLDPRLPEHAGSYSRDGTQAAQPQLFA